MAVRFANISIVVVASYLAVGLVYGTLTRASVPLLPLPLSVVMAALLVGVVGASRLRTSYRVNAALLMVSTLVPLLVVEVVLAATGSDERSVLQVVGDLRDDGADVYPAISPKEFLDTGLVIGDQELFPLSGIGSTTTVYCREAGDYIMYQSDEYGFRNPLGIWEDGDVDIVAIGDSMTKGGCVESDRSAVALLRAQYPNTLNLGMGGIGPGMELAVVKEYLGELEPELVLWFYFEGNDIGNLGLESRRYPPYRRYLDHNYRQDLRGLNTSVSQALAQYVDDKVAGSEAARRSTPALHRAFDRLMLREIGFRLGRLWEKRKELPSCDYEPHDWTSELRELERILRDADTYVASWGGELHFVYLATQARYAAESPCLTKELDLARLHQKVLNAAQAAGLPAVDVTEAFDRHPDPLSLFAFRDKPGHYSEDGYALVAETVLPVIRLGETGAESSRDLENYVANGSFEAGGLEGWEEDIDGGLQATTAVSGGASTHGAASLRIDISSSRTLGIARRSQDIPVKPGDVWSVAAWVKVPELSGASVRLRFRWVGAYDYFLTQETATAEWVQLRIQDRQAPEGATALRIELSIRANLDNPGGGTGTAYFDGVVALKGPRAPRTWVPTEAGSDEPAAAEAAD